MELSAVRDFDVSVTEVVLAHRYALEQRRVDIYRCGRRMHGLVCVLSGMAEYCFADGRRILLRAGDAAVIPAAAAYTLYWQGDERFEHYTVNFLGDEKTLPPWVTEKGIWVIRPRNFALCTARLEELVGVWSRRRPGFQMQTRARLLALLADILAEGAVSAADPAAYSCTLPALRIIENRYPEKITLEQLAQACGMSVSAFRRAFAGVYEQPPLAYLLRFRVEKARELLLLGFSVEETALRTGFSDANYFVRYFRTVTGMTPGRFRRIY